MPQKLRYDMNFAGDNTRISTGSTEICPALNRKIFSLHKKYVNWTKLVEYYVIVYSAGGKPD